MNSDETLLESLGYKQELRRRMTGFTNFAISFTIISVLAGTLTSFYIGFANGGPIMMSWGWPLVAGACVLIALAMAELASAMPTAGGLYFWASKLGAPVWGWFTGWFNAVGLVAAVAAVAYGAATFATALLDLLFGFPTTTAAIFCVYAAFLIVGAIVNSYGIRPVVVLNTISAWWHVVGVVVLVAVLVVVPDHHQSVSFVFTKTINASGFNASGFGVPLFWVVLGIGLLQAQYTIGGYDASAHMSEETQDASRQAARGMWQSVVGAGIAGWVLLLAMTFAVPDVKGTLNAGAFDVQYIWQTALGNDWAEILLAIAVVAQVFCYIANMTSASRVVWALSRDRAMPFHETLHRTNRYEVPANAVWVIAAIDIVLMVPTFWNATIGYLVATSVTVIALYLSYALPIALRLRLGTRFVPGSWSLGRHHRWVNVIALCWIALVSVLFILPVTPAGVPFNRHFDWTVFNYTPITLAAAVLLFGGWWVLSARHWFRGPVRQVEAPVEPTLVAPDEAVVS